MRTLIRITLLLVTGVLLNVAITMACARWSDHNPSTRSTRETIQSVPGFAAGYLNDPQYLAMFGPDRPTGVTLSAASSLACTSEEYTRWHDRPHAYSRTHKVIQFGLPFRSMQYAWHSYSDFAAFPGTGSWRLSGFKGGWPLADNAADKFSFGLTLNRPKHIYPLDILTLGFTANTLIYALLLLPIFLPLSTARRRRRLRKGLCPNCVYPIGLARVCTECGHNLPPKSASIP